MMNGRSGEMGKSIIWGKYYCPSCGSNTGSFCFDRKRLEDDGTYTPLKSYCRCSECYWRGDHSELLKSYKEYKRFSRKNKLNKLNTYEKRR
jgi:hypothetical protein